MKRILRIITAFLIALLLIVAVIWLGPRDQVILKQRFDISQLDNGIEAYLARAEARFDDIRPGLQKEVIWANGENIKTDLVVVYFHGFSASKGEIRPVPDQVAKALGANLYYPRMPGHGRNGAAMGKVRASEWLAAYDEAMAIAARLGQRILLIASSTGATISTLGLHEMDISAPVIGAVYLSPNFKVNNPLAPLANYFGFRVWGPWLAGAQRESAPKNDLHARYWTTRYPLESVVPMMRLVDAVDHADLGDIDVPLLLLYSSQDQVVVPARMHDVLKAWGGHTTSHELTLTDGDDPLAHVIAGDARSPDQTLIVIDLILDWFAAL